MCTREDTDVTTTNITADIGSINIDQLTSNDPEFIQVAIIIFLYLLGLIQDHWMLIGLLMLTLYLH